MTEHHRDPMVARTSKLRLRLANAARGVSFRGLTATLWLISLSLVGCAAAPAFVGKVDNGAVATPSSPTPPATISPANVSAAGLAQQPGSQSNTRAMQDVMAELCELDSLDPVGCAKLREDLRKNDPSLWPLMIKQFRATLAYRRAARSPQTVVGNAATPPVASPVQSLPVYESTQVSASNAPDEYRVAPENAAAPLHLAGGPAASQPAFATPLAALPPSGAIFDLPNRLPATADATMVPTAVYPDQIARTAPPVMPLAQFRPERATPILANGPMTCADSGNVQQTSYTTVAQPIAEWQQRLAGTIDALERALAANPNAPIDPSLHARLRMLYVVAGRNMDALQLIPTASLETQEFWLQEFAGLSACLDFDRQPDAIQRAAAAKPLLVEAAAKLGEAAPLALRNVCFCTAVQSFGNVKRFEKEDFTANQEVLLYAEVENFVSEPTPQGYRTSLQSGYQILDANGQTVAEKKFAPTVDTCQSVRHDFFIGHQLRLPKNIQPGQYVLQLTIEDTTRHKAAQALLALTIKPGIAKENKESKPEGAPKPGATPPKA